MYADDNEVFDNDGEEVDVELWHVFFSILWKLNLKNEIANTVRMKFIVKKIFIFKYKLFYKKFGDHFIH